MLTTIGVKTQSRSEFINITSDIREIVRDSGIKSGVCYVYVPHTTAAVTINEGADPSVETDVVTYLNKMIPQNSGFRHAEGNSDAHIKTSLVGSSEMIIIDRGELQLGTWQAIFFCEFDGARSRKVTIKIMGDT